MRDSASPLRIVLSPEARHDVREALRWGGARFGVRAVRRYRVLLKQALGDIALDPELAGSRARSEFASGIRTYHLAFSRRRAGSDLGIVKAPRHFLGYRQRDDAVVDVLRVLHDSSDLVRHLHG